MIDENDFRELIATLEELGYGNAHTKPGGMELIAKEIRDGFQALDKRLSEINNEFIDIYVDFIKKKEG